MSNPNTPTAPDGSAGVVRGDYAILKLALERAEAECARLNEELAVTDTLLEDRRAVLALIPECPAHGQHCLPHQRNFIETAASAESEIVRLRGLIAALPCMNAEKPEYTCRDVRLHDGGRVDAKFWCATCKAKEAANA